jgi:hypothetical protein
MPMVVLTKLVFPRALVYLLTLSHSHNSNKLRSIRLAPADSILPYRHLHHQGVPQLSPPQVPRDLDRHGAHLLPDPSPDQVGRAQVWQALSLGMLAHRLRLCSRDASHELPDCHAILSHRRQSRDTPTEAFVQSRDTSTEALNQPGNRLRRDRHLDCTPRRGRGLSLRL